MRLLQETLNLCVGKHENCTARMFQTRVDLHKHRKKTCPVSLDSEGAKHTKLIQLMILK